MKKNNNQYRRKTSPNQNIGKSDLFRDAMGLAGTQNLTGEAMKGSQEMAKAAQQNASDMANLAQQYNMNKQAAKDGLISKQEAAKNTQKIANEAAKTEPEKSNDAYTKVADAIKNDSSLSPEKKQQILDLLAEKYAGVETKEKAPKIIRMTAGLSNEQKDEVYEKLSYGEPLAVNSGTAVPDDTGTPDGTDTTTTALARVGGALARTADQATNTEKRDRLDAFFEDSGEVWVYDGGTIEVKKGEGGEEKYEEEYMNILNQKGDIYFTQDGIPWCCDTASLDDSIYLLNKTSIEMVDLGLSKPSVFDMKYWKIPTSTSSLSAVTKSTTFISKNDFLDIVGTIYNEMDRSLYNKDEATAILSVIRNRSNLRGKPYVHTCKTSGIYGWGHRGEILTGKDNKGKPVAINNDKLYTAIIAILENLISDIDTSNGAYFWQGRDIRQHYEISNAYEDFYLVGLNFTNPAHDIWSMGSKISTSSSCNYRYETTTAFGGTIFMRYTSDYKNATQHVNDYP